MNEKDSHANSNKQPFDQSKYIQDYVKQKYDRIPLQVPRGGRDVLKRIADEHGISINKLVISAIEKIYCIKLTKDDE